MKMTTYRLERLLAAAAAMLMLALCCMPQKAQAQDDDYFTLTNGRLWWYEGPVWGSGHQSEVAFDKNSVPKSWAKVWRYNPSNVTHITSMGNVYLRLNIDNPATPYIEAVDTSAFDQYCAWQRTGSSGYYYQLWDNVRYYLVGTPSGVTVATRTGEAALDNASNWYDWDFGAAIETSSIIDGQSKTTDHWLYYNTASENWQMSGDSYERPETIIYTDYDDDPGAAEANKKYYYSYWNEDGQRWIPYGNGALFLSVKQIDHDIDITGNLSEHVTFNSSDNELRYGEVSNIDIQLNATTLTTTVRPSYVEYIQETGRCGVSLDWTRRNKDEFGYSGVAETETHLYMCVKVVDPRGHCQRADSQ